MDVILNKIIEKRCEELGISKTQGLKIFKSIPKFISATMDQGDYDDLDSFKSVYIKNLGTFYPNLKVVENINKNRKK